MYGFYSQQIFHYFLCFSMSCKAQDQQSEDPTNISWSLNRHNNFLFVWRFSIKAEPFVSVISPFKISPEKSSFYNKRPPQTRCRSNCLENLTLQIINISQIFFVCSTITLFKMVSSTNILAHYKEKQNVNPTSIIWLNIAYSLVWSKQNKKQILYKMGGKNKRQKDVLRHSFETNTWHWPSA